MVVASQQWLMPLLEEGAEQSLSLMLQVLLSEQLDVTIVLEAGGAGGISVNPGVGGQSSYFVLPSGVTMVAGGGGGGNDTSTGAGGTPGVASNGTINLNGGTGEMGGVTTTAAGAGGDTPAWGVGGAARESAGTGINAAGYGAGGGGGRGTAGVGGAGAGGMLMIEWSL